MASRKKHEKLRVAHGDVDRFILRAENESIQNLTRSLIYEPARRILNRFVLRAQKEAGAVRLKNPSSSCELWILTWTAPDSFRESLLSVFSMFFYYIILYTLICHKFDLDQLQVSLGHLRTT